MTTKPKPSNWKELTELARTWVRSLDSTYTLTQTFWYTAGKGEFFIRESSYFSGVSYGSLPWRMNRGKLIVEFFNYEKQAVEEKVFEC